MRRISRACALAIVGLAVCVTAGAELFALEDYGLLPRVRNFALSPDGRHVAYVQRGDSSDYLFVSDVDTGRIVGGANAQGVKLKFVKFLDNNAIVLQSENTTPPSLAGKALDYGTASLYLISSNKLTDLLVDYEHLHPLQTGIGRVVGFDRKENWLLMPAYVNPSNPRYSLLRFDIGTGATRILESGSRHTKNWFADKDGKVLAMENYDDDKKLHQIQAKDGEHWHTIYETTTGEPELIPRAVSIDGTSLLFTRYEGDNQAVFELSLSDGEISGPQFLEEGSDIKQLLTKGMNGTFIGVQYSGLMDASVFVDSAIHEQFVAMSKHFPGSAIGRVSATDDLSKSIFLVSGNDAANEYFLLDAETMGIQLLGRQYPSVEANDIGEVKAVRYKARDGFDVSAIVTWPVGVEDRENLPLIVVPHAGMERYSSVQFNWFTQYLARMGYAVLQPNYRGTAGFGRQYEEAGDAQWSKTVQNDIADGVTAMIKSGQVDPNRVCIIGWSYGGYTALASATFTPDLYQCVVSVAGVSDVAKLFREKSFSDKSQSRLLGSPLNSSEKERLSADQLRRISPVHHAKAVSAPVLLVHGKFDTTIPWAQSNAMNKALKKAGKEVEFLALADTGHWLEANEPRVKMLREIGRFLSQHNPSKIASDTKNLSSTGEPYSH